MILFWVTLLLLHQAHTLVPVITVQLGEPVTLKCNFPDEKSSSELNWYKQSAGESLKLIAKLLENSKHEPEIFDLRLKATYKEKVSNLTISKTVQEDEGMYHCAVTDWDKNKWNGTYLSIKGNTGGTSNYIVQQTTESDAEHSGSISLQCSVLFDSDKTCSEGFRVLWFRATSDKSYPEFIYAYEKRQNECEKKPDSQKRCVFFKNISSSDAGNYYCAVATCGQIVFGNGTEIIAERKGTPLVPALTCLAISVFVNVVFFCHCTSKAACTKLKGTESISSQPRQNRLSQTNYNNEDEQDLNYAALHFSAGKSTRENKKKEMKTEESVYSQVKR